MASSKVNNNNSLAGFLSIICIFSMIALFAFYFITPKSQREVYSFVFLVANQKALFVTFLTIFTLIFIIIIIFKRKSKFVTTAVEEGEKEFSQIKLSTKQKIIFSLPLIICNLTGIISYAIFYYMFGGQWYYLDFLKKPSLELFRIFCDFTNGFLAYLVIILLNLIFFNAFKINYRIRKKYFDNEAIEKYSLKKLPDPEDYQNSGNPAFLLGARENKRSLDLEPDVKVPSYVYYKAPMTYGGLLIFGKKGSGKSSIIRRIIEDSIKYKPQDNTYKMSMCVIDIKGDLAEFIEKKAKENSRNDDVIRLGVSTIAKWNPMGCLNMNSRAHDCRQAGFFLRCAMTSGKTSSGGSDSYWHDNADNLLFRSMHLLALSEKNVCFKEINKLIVSLNDQKSIYRAELYSLVELRFDEEGLSEDTPLVSEYRDTKAYFEDEFVLLDTKIRTTIVNVATIFLQKFLTREYEQSFGCSREEMGHFNGFRDLIAEGKIFVLDIRSNEHGTIAGPLGMLVKLFYQAAVKTRDRYKKDEFKRATLLVADEYQSFVTASNSDTEGDDKYLEMSRSFLAIDIFATQQYSSITSTVGKDMGQRIIGSFNNIISYKHNDEAITSYLDKLVGGEDKTEKSMNISESSSSADINYFSHEGNTELDHQVSKSVSLSKKKKQKITAELFASLTNFEAIGIFDTPRGLQVTRFCTKPDFCEPNDSHEVVLSSLEDKFGLKSEKDQKKIIGFKFFSK